MNAKQWKVAINIALDLVNEKNHSDDAAERAWSFVAYLAGTVKLNDAALSERISAVLKLPTEAVAK